MKWNMISTGDIALRKGGSVDPKKHQDEVFELYSVPAFDAGAPEVVAGSAIGSSKKAVQPNDVMISRIVPHIRRACVVGRANGHRQIASGEWIIFRDERIWPKYLRWVLVGDVFHSAFMRTVSGVGGSLLRARPAEVFKIQIPLPPLDEQRRIGGILDAADALRAKRREALAQLDTLLQSTFLDMFGDPVVNPMGWHVGRLEDYFSETRAGTCCGPFGSALKKYEYVEDGIPVWGIDNVNPNRFIQERSLFITPAKFAQLRRYSVKPGDILISRAGTVGRMCVAVPTVEQSIIGSNLIRLTLNPGAMLPVYFTCLYTFCGERLPGLRASGDDKSYSFLNTTRLKSLVVPVPPLDLQHRFAAIVESVEQQRARQRAHIAELDTLFASLQSRAFRRDL